MIQGKVNGIHFTLDGGKAETSDLDVKKLLENLEGQIRNPMTGETYYSQGKNDLDAFLILSQLAVGTAVKIEVEGYEGIETDDTTTY